MRRMRSAADAEARSGSPTRAASPTKRTVSLVVRHGTLTWGPKCIGHGLNWVEKLCGATLTELAAPTPSDPGPSTSQTGQRTDCVCAPTANSVTNCARLRHRRRPSHRRNGTAAQFRTGRRNGEKKENGSDGYRHQTNGRAPQCGGSCSIGVIYRPVDDVMVWKKRVCAACCGGGGAAVRRAALARRA